MKRGEPTGRTTKDRVTEELSHSYRALPGRVRDPRVSPAFAATSKLRGAHCEASHGSYSPYTSMRSLAGISGTRLRVSFVVKEWDLSFMVRVDVAWLRIKLMVTYAGGGNSGEFYLIIYCIFIPF
jgi:hypothetical protein